MALLSSATPGQEPPAAGPLLKAQQLAFVAYPELRRIPTQMRVEERDGQLIVTYGEARQDREGLLALSRPREALVVIELTVDAAGALGSARLRGVLAKTAERRRIRAVPTAWTEALAREGARFTPTRRAQLLEQIDVAGLRRLLGTLQVQDASFQTGTAEDGLYWEVTGTAGGAPVRLAFEPFEGRLIRIVRGGGQ
jgi:hypothetical protein